jgi:hypothetical protein
VFSSYAVASPSFSRQIEPFMAKASSVAAGGQAGKWGGVGDLRKIAFDGIGLAREDLRKDAPLVLRTDGERAEHEQPCRGSRDRLHLPMVTR